ncbi:MAG: hypothetical protein R3321_02120 [Nitrososphaeraceae archaeon]|nr:hypothetical protein [Nitrososphaeraceae archaeon]
MENNYSCKLAGSLAEIQRCLATQKRQYKTNTKDTMLMRSKESIKSS